LDDEAVHAGSVRGFRLRRAGDGRQHPASHVLQRRDLARVRQPEGQGHHGDGLGEEEGELVGPGVVVIEDRLGVQIRAERGCLGRQLGGVGAERGGIDGVPARHEEVHPEGPTELAHPAHLGTHRLGGLVPGGQERKATSSQHRSDQRDRGRPTRHRRRHHRQLRLQKPSHTRRLSRTAHVASTVRSRFGARE